MSNRALIVIDIQNEYFSTGKLPLVNIDQTAARAAEAIGYARKNQDLLIHFRHEFPDPDAPLFTPATPGVQIHDAAAPEEGETVIVKNYPNAFLKTHLKELLDEHNVDEVVIIGAMSHMCIEATTRAASDFGYKVTVLEDACTTMDLEFDGTQVPAAQVHATIMAGIEFAYGTVSNVSAYITE